MQFSAWKVVHCMRLQVCQEGCLAQSILVLLSGCNCLTAITQGWSFTASARNRLYLWSGHEDSGSVPLFTSGLIPCIGFLRIWEQLPLFRDLRASLHFAFVHRLSSFRLRSLCCLELTLGGYQLDWPVGYGIDSRFWPSSKQNLDVQCKNWKNWPKNVTLLLNWSPLSSRSTCVLLWRSWYHYTLDH